jgi:hypothetical protein
MRWEVGIFRHKVIVDVLGFLQRIVSRSDIAISPFALANFQKDPKLLYQYEPWVAIFASKITSNFDIVTPLFVHYSILGWNAPAQCLGWPHRDSVLWIGVAL